MGAMRTMRRRWRERIFSTPPVLNQQLFLQALRNRRPAITNELPAQPPLFVLATGRCGTNTLAALLALAPRVYAWHEPMPDLHRLALQVYHTPAVDKGLVTEAILLARSSLWQASNMAGKRYVETANYATFLAPFLHHMMPEARFLHLTRAPRPFATSATRSGLYVHPRRGGSRLAPRPDTATALSWDDRDPFAKCVWFWQEVNSFAQDFLRTLPPGQALHLRSEDIFSADPDALRQLFTLIDCEPPPQQRIRRVLGRQLNAGSFRAGTRPPEPVSDEQLELLQEECGELARELGYKGLEG